MTWVIAAVAALVAGVWLGPKALALLIRRRLGGYRRSYAHVDAALPTQLTQARSVAVIGGGVAGLVSAVTLARRGFQVTVYEAAPYLGGKLGSWPVRLTDGTDAWVSHGFHAFFPHYLNLNRFLDSMNLRASFESIGEYVIVGPNGDEVRFGRLDTTPVFNLLSLARAGVFRISEALRAPGRDLYGLFLEYEHDATFAKYDQLSFADFNRRARVPPRLKLAFNTFARAFFADDDKLSLAELLKSFHFYYLGQDGGLVYAFPTRDYEPGILAPIRAELGRHGATLRLQTSVTALRKTERGFDVDGAPFDAVVMAADVVGARAILGHAQGLPAALCARFEALRPGQRYAVLRLWVDRDVRTGLPHFVITDRHRILDAVTMYHRFEAESAAWVAQHGGAVLELHCYAVPDALDRDAVRQTLLDDLLQFFPELKGYAVRNEYLQLNQNFTAFHVGQYAGRPEVETGVPGLVCAGDWVKLPFPAMLLECAASSGMVAANALLAQAGLQQEPVYGVGLRGLMAGMPQPPGRRVLFEAESK